MILIQNQAHGVHFHHLNNLAVKYAIYFELGFLKVYFGLIGDYEP